MGYIEKEDIAGFRVEQRILCGECFDGNFSELSLEDVITTDEVGEDDGFYFCDKCRKTMS
jgi:hypothetical protein